MFGVLRVLSLVGLTACNFVYQLDETHLFDDSPRRLVFDNSASAIDLVDFPVAVVIERTEELRLAEPELLRFTDAATGEPLAFDVDTWVPNGESTVWVRVPRIAAGSTTGAIFMHFGDDPALLTGDGPDAARTWESYALVAHGVAADGDVVDVTANGYRGQTTNIVAVPGVLGDAIGLPGFVDFAGSEPVFDGWPQFTLELWLYADYASSTLPGQAMFLDRGGSINLGRIYAPNAGGEPPNLVTLQIDTHFQQNTNDDPYQNTLVAVHRWNYVVVTYDGRTQSMYINGELATHARLPAAVSMVVDQHPLRLGGQSGSLAGALDELRVAPGHRDPSWVYAQYLAMTGRFVSVGARSP